MHIDPEHPTEDILQQAARVIAQGGVVLHPSDTVYGLACDPFDPQALGRILEIKGRAKSKGFLVLVPGLDWIDRFADPVPEGLRPLARAFWPGPVTLLAPARRGLPGLLVGDGNTIGMRQPRLPFLQAWMEILQGPLTSTSANRSGQLAPASPRELSELFGSSVDLFLEAGPLAPGAAPSTVVDLSRSPTRLLRRGERSREVASFLETRQEPAQA